MHHALQIDWIWSAQSGPAPLCFGSFYNGRNVLTEQGAFFAKALDPG